MTIETLLSQVKTLQNQNSGLLADLFSKENEAQSARAELQLKDERLKFYEAENNFLHEVIRGLKRDKFGKKSERWTSDEQLCFNEAELLKHTVKPEIEAEISEGKEPVETVEVKVHVKERGKRRPLPKELPREVIIIDLPESERMGPNGQPLKVIGKEISEKLHFEPSKLSVIETHRLRYGEDSGDTGMVAPVPPSIVPKSYVTSGLLAHIVIQKYVYGMPLYRLEDLFLQIGVQIPRQTQARWIIEASEQLIPLLNILEEILLASPYLAVDETWTQVLKEKNRSPEAKSWMWVRCNPGDREKILLFDYDPSRSGDVAKRLLTDFKGILQVDGYGGYNWTEDHPEITRIGCNMHSRRKFETAFKIGSKSGRGLAEEGLSFYKQIYEIEEEIRGRPPDERKKIRKEKQQPLFEEFKERCELNIKKIPPRSKIAEAINYFLNEYPRLTGYLEDGILEPDNGFAERVIKNFAIGRKNWLFADTPAGAEASALFYSLIATIKANGGHPQKIMTEIFDKVPLAKSVEDYEALVDLILSRK